MASNKDNAINSITSENDNSSKDKTTVRPLEEEILSAKSRVSNGVVMALLIITLLISYFAYGSLPVYVWGTWLFAMLATMLARSRGEADSTTALPTRMRNATILTFVTGVVHASSFAFFPYFSFPERMVQTIMLLGLTNGSISTNSGYKPLFLAYSVPVAIGLTAAWALTPVADGNLIIQFGVTTLNLMYYAIQYSNASNHFRLFKQSYDIREQQAALNQELKEKNEELDSALALALQARHEADQANKSKTRFLASASHDLRQPTHALSLLAGVLSNRPLDDKSKAIAGDIHVASQGLQSLMTGLLDISKLDAGLMLPKIETVDLDWLVNRVCSEFEADCNDKGLRLILNSHSGNAVTRSDPQLTERILSNIISNAVKYTDEGRIEISLEDIDDQWKISIKDTGVGIEADEQNHIFDEFYQIGNEHRDQANGLGLGLAIVKRLTSALAINLDFQSKVGVGTTVAFSMPKVNDKTRMQESVDHKDLLKGLHILCVDDEANIRNALELVFEVLGCSYELAEGTAAAVSLAKKQKPDIVLADFRLKGDDHGLKTIDSIRKMYPEIPALLVTGDTSPERLKSANDAAIEMLHKPLTMEKLALAIGDTVS